MAGAHNGTDELEREHARTVAFAAHSLVLIPRWPMAMRGRRQRKCPDGYSECGRGCGFIDGHYYAMFSETSDGTLWALDTAAASAVRARRARLS